MVQHIDGTSATECGSSADPTLGFFLKFGKRADPNKQTDLQSDTLAKTQ